MEPHLSRLVVRRATVFAVAAGIPLVLALNGGGYDLVVRQEAALVLWAAIALGLAFGVLPRGRPRRAVIIPALAAAALVLWILLGFTWSESDERTTAELARLLGYLGLVTLALTGLNRHTFRAAAAGLTAVAAAIAGLALASRLFPGSFPAATEVARIFRVDRLDYPLDYWNAVGAWGAMAVAACLAWSAHARLPLIRALSLAAVPVAGAAVYLTYSRGGAIGSAAGVLAVLVLSRNRWTALLHTLVAASATAAAILVVRSHGQIADATGGAGGGDVLAVLLIGGLACAGAVAFSDSLRLDRMRLPRSSMRFAPAAAALLAVLVAAAAAAPLSRGWDEFRNEQQARGGGDPAARLTSAGGNRNDLWSSALDAFRAHPLDGTGAGTFEFWWSRDGRDPEYVRDAHSLYLETLAEQGLPGLLALLGFLGGLLLVALQARARLRDPADAGACVAMIAIFAVFFVTAGVDWMWEETAVAALGLGAIAVAATGGSRRLRGRRRRGRLWRPGVRPAAVALALLAAAVQVPGMVSTQRVRASQAAARAGDLPRSEQLAREAIDAEPWAAGPHLQLALVLEQRGALGAAAAEARRAAAREPTNWRHPLALARIEAEGGRTGAALATFRAGRRLRPRSGWYSPFGPLGLALYSPAQLRRIAAGRGS